MNHSTRSLRPVALGLVLSLLSFDRAGAAAPPREPAREEEAVVLNPFEVTTRQDLGYLSREATASGRVVQSLENIPQSITIVNAAMIEDTAATSAIDALRFAAGALPNTDERNSTAINVRGFSATAMRRNGELMGNGTFPMSEFTEQIELVKGPAAVLYGASQPGGLVNVVTKMPRFKSGSSLTLTGYGLGNTGGYTSSFDVTGPLPVWKDEKGRSRVAYRLVGVHERRRDFRINDDRIDRDGIFGKVTANLTDGLTLQTEFEHYQMATNIPSGLILAASEAAKPARQRLLPDTYLPVGWSAQSDDSRRYNYVYVWQSSLTYTLRTERFGDWTARMYLTQDGNYNQRPQTVSTGNNARPRPVVQADLGKDVNLDQRVTQADIATGRLWVPLRNVQNSIFMNSEDLKAQWDITGRFGTGPVKHTLLVGTETSWGSRNPRVTKGGRENDVRTPDAYAGAKGSALAVWVDSPNLSPVPVNWNDIKSPANPGGTVTQVLQGGTATGEGYDPEIPWIDVTPNTYYFHDDVSFLNDRGVISLGVRHDEIEQNVLGAMSAFNQWTYRYGAIAKVRDWVHLYASHSESFTANPSAAANDLRRVIPPQNGTQDEVGLRFAFWRRRLNLTVAAFRLENSNLVVRNAFAPVGAPPEAFWTFIDGTKIKGFDVDATLNLTPETQILASYAYLDGSNTPTPEQVLASPGIREIPLNLTARDQLTFWGKWTAGSSRLKNLSIRAGYRWIGERPGGRLGFAPDMWLPGYGIADLGAGYRWKRTTVDFLVRNIFDKYAFRSTGGEALVFPEKPRNATVRIKYTF